MGRSAKNGPGKKRYGRSAAWKGERTFVRSSPQASLYLILLPQSFFRSMLQLNERLEETRGPLFLEWQRRHLVHAIQTSEFFFKGYSRISKDNFVIFEDSFQSTPVSTKSTFWDLKLCFSCLTVDINIEFFYHVVSSIHGLVHKTQGPLVKIQGHFKEKA